jgi:hypothetical protein
MDATGEQGACRQLRETPPDVRMMAESHAAQCRNPRTPWS